MLILKLTFVEIICIFWYHFLSQMQMWKEIPVK